MAENRIGRQILLCTENFPQEHPGTSHSTSQYWGDISIIVVDLYPERIFKFHGSI
ncbi:uncharacterized protein CLUP02_18198 [Colletotrichum lupini]|uniref:Uncharacterized protein n=1 Tax=Colletotrichum lupini TaxID=145971 RepID=A0A9Q8SG04_9PEZI|nr:uncharacterized protein CLUP02_18198 [Colletotrichum lupini]UQC76684.1 hypothetical protein CLUP02_18198 [Colletotrichum lupini]